MIGWLYIFVLGQIARVDAWRHWATRMMCRYMVATGRGPLLKRAAEHQVTRDRWDEYKLNGRKIR